MKTKYTILDGNDRRFCARRDRGAGVARPGQAAAYGIAEVTVNNQDGYSKEFLPAVRKTIADAGGKFLAAGGKTKSMTGTPPAPRVVIIQWPNLDAADAWWNAAATKDAFKIGEKYATLRTFAVEGLPAQ